MSRYTGTARLIRLALRRDRVQLPIWLAGSAVLMAAGVTAVVDEFPDQAQRTTALLGAGRIPAVLFLRGTPVGTSTGALVNFRNFSSMLVVAALMSTFAVVRHTRQNEETGRADLIGAAGVGRYASLTAALALAVGANLLLGATVSGALLATGLPPAGAAAFGAACAGAGIAFAGLAAVAAQLFQSARAANACAGTAIAVAFAVRGVGDALGRRTPGRVEVTSGWLSWLSPLGWGTQVHPYGEQQRWWPLVLPVALAAVCAAAAFALVDRRDLGAGLIPYRPGPAAGSAALLSPLGLAWRLNRASTLGWVLGCAAFGVGIGWLASAANATTMEPDTGPGKLMGQLAGTGGADLGDTYFAAMMGVFGVLAAGFVVQALLRLRSEEATGAAEALLATAVGRTRWVGAHLACAAGGAAALLLLTGAATGIADAAAGGHTGVVTLTAAGLVQLPAALAVAGFVVLAFGGLPRLVVVLAWTALAVSIAGGLLGGLLGLPRPVRDLSPFSHVPAVPAVDASPTPILALLAVSAALAAAGLALFRRRDLAP